MRKDNFNPTHCDRCKGDLGTPRVHIMSWFTEELICMDCKEKEQVIRAQLPNHGLGHEGCGYIPESHQGQS